jgi:hypothetical protein
MSIFTWLQKGSKSYLKYKHDPTRSLAKHLKCMKKGILWICMASLMIMSCHKHDHLIKRIGLDFNYKRKLLGLPLLPKNWKLVSRMEGSFTWMPLHYDDSLAFYSKVVTVKNKTIYSEGNSFFGRKKYQTVDGTFFEELSYSCYFDQNGNILKWQCEYRGSKQKFDNLDVPFNDNITKNQADSIIANWGLTNVFK